MEGKMSEPENQKRISVARKTNTEQRLGVKIALV